MVESFGLVLDRDWRYARSGRVLRIEMEAARLEAHVQGSRYEPYRVRVRMKMFTLSQWERAIEALASQALFAAKLLAGEMPRNIEDAFQAIGLSLFPSSEHDITTSCSCFGSGKHCRHIAAVLVAMSEQFEQDPFQLFLLRGFNREQVLGALRARRAAEALGRSVTRRRSSPLSASVDRFWETGEGMDSIAISVGPPTVSAGLLKRLAPAFWKSHPEIRGALERLYAKVTERSMALAYGGKGSESARPRDRGKS